MTATTSHEAAAFHGIATNVAFPAADRLAAALQALDWYEAEVERLRIEAERLQTAIDKAAEGLEDILASPWMVTREDH